MTKLFGLFLSTSALAAPALAQSRPALMPGPGVFLVARPSIDGGAFYESVVLLLSHGDEGTLGLIVNRPTEVPLAEALPDLDSGETGAFELHFGGPVGLDGLLFLFRSADPPKEVAGVMDDVYFSGDKKVLEKLLKKKEGADRLKLYLGHSGWAPGQLQREIELGSWDLVRADAFTVFQKAPETLWRELSKSGTLVAGADPARRSSGRSSRPSSRIGPARAP